MILPHALLRSAQCCTAVLLLALSLPRIALAESGTEQDRSKMNVLLVVFDDLNMDIGTYGNTDVKTPYLDAFAKRSTRFDHAHCNGTYCAPSRTSFLTGLYPSTTEIYGGEKYNEMERTKDLSSVFNHFRKSDYDVFGVGKLFHPAWDEAFIHSHFDQYYSTDPLQIPKAQFKGKTMRHPGNPKIRDKDTNNASWGPISAVPTAEKYGAGWEGWGRFRYVSEQDRDKLPDEESTAWAIEQLKRTTDKPFFLSVGYFKPHTPLYAPDCFFEMYDPAKLKMRPVLDNDLNDVVPAMRRGSMYTRTWELIQARPDADEVWRDYYRAYLACISFADHEFGKLIQGLEESGQADNTIVIVTSDHGYHFGDKQRIGKGTPWNGTTQIPLLVRVPGITTDGAICKQPVSLVDLYPTLIDLCKLPGNPHGDEFPLDGHSWKPILADVNAAWEGPPVAYNNCYSHAWTVCSDKFRYVLDPSGSEELYDLTKDPNEWHNVAGQADYKRLAADLKQQLLTLSGGKLPSEKN